MQKLLKFYLFLLLLIIAGNNQLYPHEKKQSNRGGDFASKLTDNWRWLRYGLETGLPAEKVTAITESPDGRLWVRTNKGFAWFDSYKWHDVKSSFDLSAKALTRQIFPYGNKGIITAYGGDIVLVDKSSMNTKQIIYEGKKIYVLDVVPFDDGKLLLRGVANGEEIARLYVYEGNSVKKSDFPDDLILSFDANFFYYHNDVIIANNGKSIYRYSGKKWIKIIDNNDPIPFILNNKIETDSAGNAYLFIFSPAKFRGLWKSTNDGGKERISKFENNMQTFAYSQDILLAIFKGSGIEYFYGGEWNHPGNIQFDLISANHIFFSSDGNLWAATDRGLSLCRLQSNRWNYWTMPGTAKSNNINEIIKDRNGNYWIASTEGLFIRKPDSALDSVMEINGRRLYLITGLVEDRNGHIWISSGGDFYGAYRWNGQKWQHFNGDDGLTDVNIHKIHKDRKENLWFLTLDNRNVLKGDGCYKYDYESFEHIDVNSGLMGSRVYSFLEGKDNDYWIGTYDGLSRLRNNEWTYWSVNNGFFENRIYDIAMDSSGIIWVTDRDQGIYTIRNDSVFIFKPAEQEQIINIMNMEFDSHNGLWLTTQDGIYYYRYGAFSGFNLREGLKRRQSWPIYIEKDSILFGLQGGGINVLRFDEQKSPLPKLIIDKPLLENNFAVINWEAYAYKGQIPHQNIEVRYKLNGGKWSDWNTRRSVTYNSLDPGDQIFTVQVKNQFSDYEEGSFVAFHIPYPLYQRPVFYIPILLLTLALVILLIFYFVKTRKNQKEISKLNSELEDRVIMRTSELEETLDKLQKENFERKNAEEQLKKAQGELSEALAKEKELNEIRSRFIEMISHEYRTPLTVILSSNELIKYANKDINDNKIKRHNTKIETSVKALTRMLEDTLIFRQSNRNEFEVNYSHIDLVKFSAEVLEEIRIIDNNNHNFFFICEEDEIPMITDQRLIHQILINLLSNAAKYSLPDTEIILKLSFADKKAVFDIQDSGKGMKADEISKIFQPFYRNKEYIGVINGTGLGLSIVKKCIDALKGDITIDSAPGRGTAVSVILPELNKV